VSFHPWKSCHVTTESRASTYVTPWPLWQGLVVVVVNRAVSPPTRWTRLCGAPTIAPYRPWQQPVRTCRSPRLGMAARLRFQGLPLPAPRHARFQGPRVQFIDLEVVGLLTSYHRTLCSLTSCWTFQFNVVVDVPGRMGRAGPGRPRRCCSCFLCS
jgi:hypothetical protein